MRILMSATVLALMAAVAAAEPSPESAFDNLKSLAGEWQADLPGFETMTITIRLVSGGKAIEETIGTRNLPIHAPRRPHSLDALLRHDA
jgi:hypothetical protein